MPKHRQLASKYYSRDVVKGGFLEQPLVRDLVVPAEPEDPPQDLYPECVETGPRGPVLVLEVGKS